MRNALRCSKLFVKENAPTILTSIGGVGVVSTAVMAAKATPKAMLILEEAENEKGEELTRLEKVKVAGPIYIPTVLMGAATIVCIFGANSLNQRNQAALTSAYAMVSNSYQEYKKKVEDIYGKEGELDVVKSIAGDKYDEDEVEGEGELFYDEFSGRFFHSTVEAVQRAEYQINRDLVMQDWATINNLYDYLHIPPVDGGDVIGWSTPMNSEMYWQPWIDFSHLKVVDDDGLEYYILRMYQEPMPDFENFE